MKNFFLNIIFLTFFSFFSYSQIALPPFYGTHASKQNEPLVLDNIILYFDAGNPSSYPGSGNTWIDLTPNNNDGTISGATYSSSSGGYFDFDGSNDKVTTNMSMSSWSAFTFEIWVKYNSTGSREGIVGQNNAIEFGFINSSTIQLWTSGDGTLNWGFNNTSLPSNVWHHIVGIGTGYQLRLYINGVLKTTTSAGNGTYASSGSKFNIARGVFDPGGSYFDGQIAVVRVHNTALLSDDVLQNYNAEKDRF